MFDLGFIILVGVASAIVGLIIGIGLHRGVSNAEIKVRELSKSLAKAEEKNAQYQQQVAQHFSQTAGLLNDLTEKYKDIHQHLAAGANQLCRDENGQSLLVDGPNRAGGEQHPLISDHPEILQPPLDYAPKADNAQSGTLSEDYGLEKINLNEAPETRDESSVEPVLTDTYTQSATTQAAEAANSSSNETSHPNVRAI